MSDKKRRYKVWETKDGRGELILYFVTDRYSKEEDEDGYRTVAEFPVGPRHDKDEQARRAEDYAAYMNKLVEAAEQAYEHNKLINILKA
jgi:hypothetical protein